MDCNSKLRIFESREGLLRSFLSPCSDSALRQSGVRTGLDGALGPCSKLHIHLRWPWALLIHTPLMISFSFFLPHSLSSAARSERMELTLVRVRGQRSVKSRQRRNQNCNRVGRGGGQDIRGRGGS